MARFTIPSSLKDDPDIVALHRQFLVEEIDRTLSLAEVRSLPFDELLTGIECLPNIDNSSEIIFRACEYEPSLNQAYSLAESVRRLADSVEELPSRLKPTYDRAIRRILSRLPAEVAWPVCSPWLEHKRKFRRETAYLVLRKTGVDETAGARLLGVFQSTGDQMALELIARNPLATRNVNIETILPLFDDEYWRMRLVEAVLMDDETKSVMLATKYPREFTHAVGRQKQKSMLPKLNSLFDLQSENLEFLSIYAWALGQIGAMEEIRKLRVHIERLRFLA
ncbi:hypothetical protein QWJ46_07725 [Rhizobium sp. CBN3]|uniref:hypothetical protein n=1 Tax=Rhizobium sp. CBN3 TaxID=3058045 RepID=UPI002670FA4A|nr:hypothetical protein [Rhizobium sp. CBN3]MDO3432572.1 hypothetical protein [Rhizobium sp. CBN3]